MTRSAESLSCALWREPIRKDTGNQGKPLSASGRVDPWECYQDTWQTTCSVLEHHRDLMKVSWAAQRGGRTAEAELAVERELLAS